MATRRGKAVRAGKPARRPRVALAGSPAARGEEREWLVTRRIEDLAQGYISLAAELWITRDRLAVLEHVLDEHGIPATARVDSLEPEGALRERLDADRKAYSERMIAALIPGGMPPID